MAYDLRHHLREAAAASIDRWSGIYLSGALITLGDALSEHDYFDRAPVLEVVRHMRNAVAHGNRFRFVTFTDLERHPAHTADVGPARPSSGEPYVIDLELEGTCCLFDFMDTPGVLDLVNAVESHLLHLTLGS